MKNLSLLLLMTMLGSLTYGQNYYPLVENNHSWNILSVGLTGDFPPDTIFSQVNYKLLGDTSIDAVSYKKVYKEMGEDAWELQSYLREDTDKRVWYRALDEVDEFLFYDFSMEPMDVVEIGCMEPVSLTLDSISWVTVDQTLRKKFWLSNTSLQYGETWIEGIGSEKGLLFSGSALLVGGYYNLLCVSDEGALIYQNPDYESCDFVNAVQNQNIPNFEVYPNPATDFLRINSPNNQKLKNISIVNILGQKIQDFGVETQSLDISGISPGLYFIKIKYAAGEWVEKIVIE